MDSVMGVDASISIQRATVLLAMSRSWATLGDHMERYEAILEEEGTRRGSKDAPSAMTPVNKMKSAFA
jgi:hypothetical protein